MDREVLVSAVGFRPEMILPLVEVMEPDAVELVSGKHGKVVEVEREVSKALKEMGLSVSTTVVDDWDMLAWSKAITEILDRHRRDHVTINLTAGHGLALAMLSVHSAKRSLPVACYDWEPYGVTGKRPRGLAKYVHHHSPAAVLNLDQTTEVDRRVLGALLAGPQTVMQLAQSLEGIRQSTLSTSLARLLRDGFLNRQVKGRNRIYSIRDGLHPMLASALGQAEK